MMVVVGTRKYHVSLWVLIVIVITIFYNGIVFPTIHTFLVYEQKATTITIPTNNLTRNHSLTGTIPTNQNDTIATTTIDDDDDVYNSTIKATIQPLEIIRKNILLDKDDHPSDNHSPRISPYVTTPMESWNDLATTRITDTILTRNNLRPNNDNNPKNENTGGKVLSNEDKKNKISTNKKKYSVTCLIGEFGRTCNQLIEMGNVLRKLRRQRKGTNRLGLLPGRWTEFYTHLLQPQDDIWVNYTGTCHTTTKAETAFFLRPNHRFNPDLMTLLPQVSIRQKAVKAIQATTSTPTRSSSSMTATLSTTTTTISNRTMNNLPTFVSVHRRILEGWCYETIRTPGDNFCITKPKYYDTIVSDDVCNVTYSNVTDHYAQTYLSPRNDIGNSNTPHHPTNTTTTTIATPPSSAATSQIPPIVLFTDGQAPLYDQTFPNIDTNPFEVQLWMMVLSQVHYGNPTSSVDYVIYHWRRWWWNEQQQQQQQQQQQDKDGFRNRKDNLYTMEPSNCFPVNP